MTILIEDSPRNLLAWIHTAVNNGVARGAVLTPFATPRVAKPHRRSAAAMSNDLVASGAEVWFDATTHALQMGGVGDYRYYDEYTLWGGPRGDLSTTAARHEHLRLVFGLQENMGANHLAPTVLLHHGESNTSQLALEMAQEAAVLEPDSWLTVAGTAPFWSSERALDAHIGALAQVAPAGWFITVARPLASLPVGAEREEIHGLCRTVRALSEHAPVHISHGDLAGLPAVAAGAFSLGTGWDQRQRVCGFNSYASRDAGGGGGGWYERPTFPGLLGSLKPNEAALLARVDAPRARRLGPVPPPGPEEAFEHHLQALSGLVNRVRATGDFPTMYRELAAMYSSAAAEWTNVQAVTGCTLGPAEWIDGLAAGLSAYGAGEGW